MMRFVRSERLTSDDELDEVSDDELDEVSEVDYHDVCEVGEADE